MHNEQELQTQIGILCAGGHTPLLNPVEIRYMRELLQSPGLPAGNVLEVGFHLGGTVSLLLPYASGRQWWACDVYPLDGGVGPSRLLSGASQALYHLSGVHLVLCDVRHLSQIARQGFALALIDGSHEKQAVMSDVGSILGLMVEGGVVVLHDSVNQPSCPGSMAAWQSLCAEDRIVDSTGRLWVTESPDAGTLGVLRLQQSEGD